MKHLLNFKLKRILPINTIKATKITTHLNANDESSPVSLFITRYDKALIFEVVYQEGGKVLYDISKH